MLKEEQIESLSELIEDGYGKNRLADFLDAGIEMLFYVDEETFDKRDVQNVASAMRAISKALRK